MVVAVLVGIWLFVTQLSVCYDHRMRRTQGRHSRHRGRSLSRPERGGGGGKAAGCVCTAPLPSHRAQQLILHGGSVSRLVSQRELPSS